MKGKDSPKNVRNNSFETASMKGSAKDPSPKSVMEKKNSFDKIVAASRNNSVEKAAVPLKNNAVEDVKVVYNNSKVQAQTTEVEKLGQNVAETKKQPIAPPPRKSSDPNSNKQLIPPPKTSSPAQVAKQVPKAASPKLKHQGTNGSPPIIPNVPTIVPIPEIGDPVSKEDTQPKKAELAGAESNGVGDKIRKFERAAEDATGKLSRPGSIRNKAKNEITEKINPVAQPSVPDTFVSAAKMQTSKTEDSTKTFTPPTYGKWRKEDSETPIAASKHTTIRSDVKDAKPEPKINRLSKEMPKTPAPTLKNVSFEHRIETPPNSASEHSTTQNIHQSRTQQVTRKENETNDDVNTHGTFKTCKFKPKERYAPVKQSSYFSRGTEEIWMVKKKDIEEIEDRVLGSFIRAGGNASPANSEVSRTVSFAAGSSVTLGRTKRTMYARSESLDPQYAVARSQTLKRQSSVACTCGHDKKNRSKSSGASTPVSECTAPPRPRSRSHGDDHAQGHILDKYETLV